MRVAAYVPDLLFGSRLAEAIRAGGHEVQMFSSPQEAGAADADVLVADLASDLDGGLALATARAPRRLAAYSHVDAESRARAQAAGFDGVYPRSRWMREGAALVTGPGPS